MDHTAQQLQRLENKVDKLTDAVTQLVRVEERQITHGVRLGDVENRITHLAVVTGATEKRLDQWINRGIGMWSIAVVLWSVFLAFKVQL